MLCETSPHPLNGAAFKRFESLFPQSVAATVLLFVVRYPLYRVYTGQRPNPGDQSRPPNHGERAWAFPTLESPVFSESLASSFSFPGGSLKFWWVGFTF